MRAEGSPSVSPTPGERGVSCAARVISPGHSPQISSPVRGPSPASGAGSGRGRADSGVCRTARGSAGTSPVLGVVYTRLKETVNARSERQKAALQAETMDQIIEQAIETEEEESED